MTPSGVISLLTDFGLSDPFVGLMKAAILREFPAGRVVDLCHGLAAQDITAAAFWLAKSYRFFPPGTVHVAVVDPGVGTERAALLVAGHGHWFLGPDNGLLAGIATEDARVYRIDSSRLGLTRVSRTFHGRDLFAPVAGRLAAGFIDASAVGPAASVHVADPLPQVTVRGTERHGQVVVVDRFGNALTNLEASMVSNAGALAVCGRELPILGTYGDAEPGQCFGLIGSLDVLEIAVRDGHAAQVLGLKRGSPVVLR